jgi:CubicO group peptidase (beta-lactamase class C family)
MRLEGFAGDVIIGWNTEVTFGAAFDGALRYDIGSMSEAFTAQAVYLLIESNRLALATTLGQVFPAAPEDKRSITIGQLLVHTSGLGNTYAGGEETDRDIALGRLLSQPLLSPPGTAFTHSDDGYVVLAAAIELASGMTYETYLRHSGVIDVGMTNTVFPGDARWGARGSGGIQCSARDLYVWASRFAARPGVIPDQVMRPFQWNDGVGIGHGWFSTPNSDTPIKWASGTSDSDDNVIVVVYPSNAILVVASNLYNGGVPWSERVATSLDPLLQSWVPPSMVVEWSAAR